MVHNGHVDILGQMILQQGFEIPDKTRLPSQLECTIPYLTMEIRRRIVETPLSLEIIQLDRISCKTRRLEALECLLIEHHHTLVVE